MDDHRGLAERFEGNRTHLRAVAYRMRCSTQTSCSEPTAQPWRRVH
jgi:hypothetical protein